MSVQRRKGEGLVRDVTSRGARLRFTVYGQGTPVVLVHDFLSSGLAWSRALPHFGPKLQLIVPDLPGFGDSEKPPPDKYSYSPETFAETIMDLTAAIGTDRFSICGHGLGGAVALSAAANHPARIRRLILVNPVVYSAGLEPFWRLAALPILGPLAFKQLLGRGFFRRHMARTVGPSGDDDDDGTVSQLFEQFNSPAAREAAYATMKSLQDPRTISASLPRIYAPTLVLWGRHRGAQPVEYGRRLARELQQCRLQAIDCDGSPAQASPEAFARDVERFVESETFP